jgi:hypothetical protein
MHKSAAPLSMKQQVHAVVVERWKFVAASPMLTQVVVNLLPLGVR